MKIKNEDMEMIFNKLSERNKDIIILIAKGMKVEQDSAEQPRDPVEQTA